MFKDILTISGRAGLFKMVSPNKNMVIVEALADGKRFPSYPHEKISMLKEIIMFSQSGDKHLNELLKKAYEMENGQKIAVSLKSSPAELKAYFAKILPDFDEDRIYPNDIKHFIQWYNILLDAKITDFEVERKGEEEKKVEEKPVKKTEAKPKKVEKSAPKASTKSAASKQPTRVAVKKGS